MLVVKGITGPTVSRKTLYRHAFFIDTEHVSYVFQNGQCQGKRCSQRARTHIHTHIPCIHQCVMKTAGCGTVINKKYTNLQCKILQTFHTQKNGIINHLYT